MYSNLSTYLLNIKSSKVIQGLKFPVSLFVVYALFHTLYFSIADTTLAQVYHYVVTPSASVINFILPSEQVTVSQNALISSRAHLEVVRGCDGIGVMMLIISAILVFSTSLKHKIAGLIAGVVLVYLLNLIRIIGLYFIVVFQRDWFLPVHSYLAPTLIILLCSLFFMHWAFMTCTDENH